MVYVDPKSLKPWPGNPRIMRKSQKAALSKSLAKFDFVEPLVVRRKDSLVIGGHQRLTDALEKGMSRVPIVRIDVKTEKDLKALNLALNQISGDWDEEKLVPIFQDLKINYDMSVTGFTEADMTQIFRSQGILESGEEDEIPDMPTEPITKQGDIWQLDKHRILCGDSTNPEDVGKLFGESQADLMVTSPPYFNQKPEYSFWDTYEQYKDFLVKSFILAVEHAKENWLCAVNVGHDQSTNHDIPSSSSILLENCKLTYVDSIAWIKSGAVFDIPRSMHISSTQHYFPALGWEPILIFRRGKHPSFEESDISRVREYQTNVWQMNQVFGSQRKSLGIDHPAPFPLELPIRLVRAYSKKESLVHDPFLGAGTTLIACEELGRVCYGCEISPAYVDVCVKRWENLTGRKAERCTD
jgi:site-specific DNA-methyltransferase (adenine-specific)